MALINQDNTFDALQSYIDSKIGDLPLNIEALFVKYGIDDILANQPIYDKIISMEDSINAVISLEDNITSTIAMEDLLNDIVTDPLYSAILGAEDNADESYIKSREAEAEALTADSWANEAYNTNVKEYYYDVATDTILFNPLIGERSAYHWSQATRFSSGTTEWGTITGTITNQTDLMTEFDKKFNYEVINIASLVKRCDEFEDQIQDVALLVENSKVVY
jgi:hypothetical protein